MKILTANIAFGLENMDRFLPNVRGHFAIHGWKVLLFPFTPWVRHRGNNPSRNKRIKYIKKHTDLSSLLSMVLKSNPDILIVNEVIYQIQGEGLIQKLREQGFISFAWGPGGHYPEETVSTLIASKIMGESSKLEIPQFPAMGGGGGIACLRLTEKNISVIGLHLATQIPLLWQEQVRKVIAIAKKEKENRNNVIIGGDWNTSETSIRNAEDFGTLDLISGDPKEIPTCPTYLPKLKPLDHIFFPKHWPRKKADVIHFKSDHLALCVETEIS